MEAAWLDDLRRFWARLGACLASDDPRQAMANKIAMVIVANQPFYPLYLLVISRDAALASLVTLMSTPFFAAVPVAGRRGGRGGRVLLVAAGLGNTAVSAITLGTATMVELFLIPCLMLAGLLATSAERGRALGLALLVGGGGMALARLPGLPLAMLDDATQSAMAGLHAISVGCLSVLILVMARRMRRAG